jgi:aspartyl-tRNA(Asn)/glutamyl-tRNA(Gln) amidotransferase subunit A
VLSEAAVHHATTLERCAADYTPNVRLRLESGRQIPAEDYVGALAARDVLTREVDQALAGLDGLVLPPLPIPAPTIGQSPVHLGGSHEQIRSDTQRLTQQFNQTGHPAISMPCGRTPAGLPVGLQVVGHRDRTAALLGLARQIEPHVDPRSTASNGCAAVAPQSPSS